MALTLITFSAGTKIKSSEVNSNFNAINTRLFALTNENIAGGAAIVDTKLAQITSSDKVSGAAIVNETIDSVVGQFTWTIPGSASAIPNISFELEATATLSWDSVKLRAKTAAAGAATVFDINLNGISIFSTPPRIAAGASTGGGSAVFDTGTHGTSDQFAAGDVLTLDCDSVGATPAADVTVILICKQKVPQ